MSPEELQHAEETWRTGDSLAVGRQLFEALPPARAPLWSAAVLRCALTIVPARPRAVENALRVAADPARWSEGHQAFRAVRDETLKSDARLKAKDTGSGELRLAYVLGIAELAAKVAYNATDPIDPFDDDSGWWLARLMRRLADVHQDANFERAAWAALSSSP